MLEELRVRNLALIEEAAVRLNPGLNVVSGETGEGKSLLLSAVLLLAGDRADKALVRTGADEAGVDGLFRIDEASAAAIAAVTDLVRADETELLVRRVVMADGRSRAYINGQLCAVGVLKAVGAHLVDVHGQRDQQSLLRPAEQALALDRFGGLTATADTVRGLWQRAAELTAALAAARSAEDRSESHRADLQDAVDELQKLAPVAGEAEALETEWKLLARAADIVRVLSEVVDLLDDGEHPVGARAGKVGRRLDEFAVLDPRLADIAARVETMKIEAADLARTTDRLRRAINLDAARLDTVEKRLDALRTAARKHHTAPESLTDRLAALDAELAALSAAPGPEKLAADLADTQATLHAAAVKLLAARRRAGATLSAEVVAGLQDLRLPHARFEVDPGAPSAPSAFKADLMTSAGYGRPRLHVSMNPGEPVRPVEDVASGGEMARVMLALKGALAKHHHIPMLVFDEIDAGIGGRVGTAFGRRLASVASHHQVLVVTHLAQVAAFASTHLLVRKRTDGKRTSTTVAVLDQPGRVRELAEMLAGSGDHPHATAQARDLLAEAGA